MKFIVTSELHLAIEIEVEIEADDKDAAMEAATDLLPQKVLVKDSGWKFAVDIKPPKGVVLRKTKPYFVEQASGGEKVRKARA